jgi:hypothetical protein
MRDILARISGIGKRDIVDKILVKINKLEMSEILRATHQGNLSINDFEIESYVLENGQRVLSGRGVQKAIGISSKNSGTFLSGIMTNHKLQPIISQDLKDIIENRIKFKRKTAGGSQPITYGYNALILPEICNLILLANDNNILDKSYEIVIKTAGLLVRSLAKIGIISLVDEATGYQLERDKKELERILAAYISKELLPWQKKFPDEFYIQIFRLKNWQSDPIKERSPFVGKITNDVIYSLLPPGILEELKSKNPFDDETKQRKFKHHQFLTPEIGNKHLEKQLTEVITLMRISENWDEFEGSMFKAFSNFGKGQTIPLGFE